MLITLSPAKLLDFDTPIGEIKSSKPIFGDKAIELNKCLQELSQEEIADLMKINPTITQQVYEYVHTFELDVTKTKQAAFAFNGIAYQGLDAASLSESSLDFAQEHLITLSGLYGIIRPLDKIKPYRLEMGRKLKNPKGDSVYDYWSDTVTEYINSKLEANRNVWVNLSSNEYTKVVDKKKLSKDCTLITPQFKEARGDKFRQIVVYTKKARGMLARFIVENELEDPEHIKAFDYEGYTFAPQLSTKKDWVFVR